MLALDAAGLVAYQRLPMLQAIRRSSLRSRRALTIIFCTSVSAIVSAAPTQTEDATAQVRSVLRAQQDAWNRGDIDRFMNGYARSASTVFISENTVRRGWETVRERYRKKYSDR